MIDMKPGTVAKIDDTIHHCDDDNNVIRYYAKTTGCVKYGKKYKEDEEFKQNHLRYKCKNGIIDIIGCYMDDIKRNLEIGDIIVDKHMLYKCYFENGAVKYEQYPCGMKGMPSCEISRQQQISIKQFTMPKHSQGFGAFSVAQVKILI
ncbi:hypothetical protein LOAG_15043 [Loa loa]|uniref:Abnormal cell migration protein 18-like fibronectin type I domain-containing protein n=1 Tax=Loa loa TaxID=7209 RepID=A0A1S0TGL6_LOALO|nr:hypothetical protein LOAG_15043 [Loa loa]EFO13486.2 hypothetical protein LOAG_15043 [Loa loa]